MKDFAKTFYKSRKWLRCRAAYIKHRVMIDGGYCEVCQERLGYIVHHKEPLTPDNINDAEITLSFDNLRYDCKDCHDREEVHPFIKDKELKCRFDENGNPIVESVTSPPYKKTLGVALGTEGAQQFLPMIKSHKGGKKQK